MSMNDNSKDEIDNFFKELKERDMLAEVLTATDSLKKLDVQQIMLLERFS